MESGSGKIKSTESQEVVQEVAQVVREYSSQADYIRGVSAAADTRSSEVIQALRAAFVSVIQLEETEIVHFDSLGVMALAEALERYPIILKPLLATCNIAGRALERDLDLRNIDTYSLNLSSPQAHAIAGFIRAFLPPALPIAALIQLDRVSFIDKEIRSQKGRWEKMVNQALTRFSGLVFKKSKFLHGTQSFELDSAYLQEKRVIYAIDVKRIEARKDIHKRSDEIANKAIKLKEIYPEAKFGAIIYYPFITEHGNIRDRLGNKYIDSIQFAGETEQSVNQAVLLLLGKFGVVPQKELP